jgi:large subunit ribosomal protein L3
MSGLIGRKVGMTQVFQEDGTVIPVTVLAMGPCPVVRTKTVETDGYAAVELAYEPVLARKVSRPRLGHLKQHGLEPHRFLREFRVAEPAAAGTVLDVTLFNPGDRVDVIGTTKGRGFQGVVRRHNYKGGPESHGCKTHDMPGSIGASAWPSHVIKGRRLPGHMGDARHTAANLTVVKIDKDRNLLIVRGAVAGGRNSLVMVRRTKKAGRK